MTRPLPLRQFRVLAYLGDRDGASVRNVAADLRMNQTSVMNALRDLAGKGLVSPDPAAYPTSFTATAAGRAALTAEAQQEGTS